MNIKNDRHEPNEKSSPTPSPTAEAQTKALRGVRCSDLVRPSFLKKLREMSGSWNPKKLLQAYRRLRFDQRHEQLLAPWQQSIAEERRYRQQRQSDLANQTARVRLRTCIEFSSGQKMESEGVWVDIPFPYFNVCYRPNAKRSDDELNASANNAKPNEAFATALLLGKEIEAYIIKHLRPGGLIHEAISAKADRPRNR